MTSPPKQLYHYTSTAGANGIRTDRLIKGTVVLSSLKPEQHYRQEILHAIYGHNIPLNCQNRADNVVLVDGTKLDSSKLRQFKNHVYNYSGDIRVRPEEVIDKPRCERPKVKASTSYGPLTYYHYTNSGRAEQIKSDGKIRGPSIITKLKPEDFFRDEILKTIYGNDYDRHEFANRADWCVIVNGKALDNRKMRTRNQDVFDYNGDIAIQSGDVVDKPQCAKAGGTSTWNSADDYKYYFHYTNTAGARGIRDTEHIKMSGKSGQFGLGVYMTDLVPTDFFREDILKNNYGGIYAAFKGRADWVVRVEKASLDSNKLTKIGQAITGDDNRSIYKYDDEIPVEADQVFDKPRCHRAK